MVINIAKEVLRAGGKIGAKWAAQLGLNLIKLVFFVVTYTH